MCTYYTGHTGNAADAHYETVTKKGILKNTEIERKKVVILCSSLTLMDHDKTCFGDYYFSFCFS